MTRSEMRVVEAPKGSLGQGSLAGLGTVALLAALAWGCERKELEFFARAEGLGGASSIPEIPSPPTPGALAVTASFDLSKDNSGSRVCRDGGDGVGYRVASLSDGEATLESIVGDGCLVAGDEVVLIALQGAAGSSVQVGEHELLRVKTVAGARVEFVTVKTRKFGASEGEDDGLRDRVVVLQRIPSYSRLVVESGGTLTARGFDGSGGGLLVARVVGDLVVDGAIEMSGKGFRGGATTLEAVGTGEQGESIAGLGARAQAANQGGGGGGLGDQTTNACVQDGNAGGGGGHLEAGLSANVSDVCASAGVGPGGLSYAASGKLFLGSGGGSGGRDNVIVDNPPGGAGGVGGGLIWLFAQAVTGSGRIEAAGTSGVGDPEGLECSGGGSIESCFDHSGPGGGGSGGTLVLETVLLEGVSLSVSGGKGGNGNDLSSGNGGDGAPGVLRTN